MVFSYAAVVDLPLYEDFQHEFLSAVFRLNLVCCCHLYGDYEFIYPPDPREKSAGISEWASLRGLHALRDVAWTLAGVLGKGGLLAASTVHVLRHNC